MRGTERSLGTGRRWNASAKVAARTPTETLVERSLVDTHRKLADLSRRNLCAGESSGAPTRPFTRIQARLWTTVAVLATLCCTGCVERWLYIRTQPVGAQVFVDGQDVGVSPARVSFEHYGHREILVRATNHASKSEVIEVSPPWYQWFPIDLLAEHFWPWTLTDQHEITVTLGEADTDALLEAVEALSKEATPATPSE